MTESFKRKLTRIGIIAGSILFIGIITVMACFTTIDPGERGVKFYKFGKGLDTENVYGEGIHVVAPWNKMIIYDVRQKTEDMTLNVLDKTGLEVGIDVSIVYQPISSEIGELHKTVGPDYKEVVIKPFPRNVLREVTGQFTAEELYSTKRDKLQSECERILIAKFEQKHIGLLDVLIRDVNLPEKIKIGIENKEAQKQKNELAEKINAEKEYLAKAAITEAEGQKQSEILRAEGKSEAIRLKQEQLRKSPNYIELVKWEGYAESGKSPYGENNVFGAGTSVLKGLK
jgi:prohibitin 1